jgi:hypothetical protein
MLSGLYHIYPNDSMEDNVSSLVSSDLPPSPALGAEVVLSAAEAPAAPRARPVDALDEPITGEAVRARLRDWMDWTGETFEAPDVPDGDAWHDDAAVFGALMAAAERHHFSLSYVLWADVAGLARLHHAVRRLEGRLPGATNSAHAGLERGEVARQLAGLRSRIVAVVVCALRLSDTGDLPQLADKCFRAVQGAAGAVLDEVDAVIAFVAEGEGPLARAEALERLTGLEDRVLALAAALVPLRAAFDLPALASCLGSAVEGASDGVEDALAALLDHARDDAGVPLAVVT